MGSRPAAQWPCRASRPAPSFSGKAVEMKKMEADGTREAGALRRDKGFLMRAKMNRYYLGLWDVRKLQLYGSATKCVQAGNSDAVVSLIVILSKRPLAHLAARALRRNNRAFGLLPYQTELLPTLRLLYWVGLANSTSTKTE